MVTLIMRGGMVALAFLLTATVAMADPIAFSVNEPGGATINGIQYMDFSYSTHFIQAPPNQFAELGSGFFGSYRQSLGGPPLPSGLGSSYNVYVLWEGSGTQTGSTRTYTTMNMGMWLDPGRNTTSFEGFISGDFSEDVPIGSGTLHTGEGHLFPGLANGDFNVLLKFTPTGGFLSGPFVLGLTLADFNGVTSSITPEDFLLCVPGVTCTEHVGSGNLSFSNALVTPEPSSLLLLGSGLAGLGLLRRRLQT